MADDDGAQELAERLLSLHAFNPLPGAPRPDVQLLVGALPSGLPLELPIIMGSEVLGSMVRGPRERFLTADIVFDVPQSEPEVLAFYRSQLGQLGWPEAAPRHHPGGGFTAALFPTTPSFCRGPQGPWLSVRVFAIGAGKSDVRLHVNQEHPGPCAPLPPQFQLMRDDLLPALEAPEGVLMRPGRGGGDQNYRDSQAYADTSLSVDDLEGFFGRQLEAAGWTRTSHGVSEALAESTWRLPKEGEWFGLLFALNPGVDRRRLLYLRAENVAASWRF